MPGGKGAGAAIDPVGGKMTGKLVASLADGGKYMLYGALAAGEPCEVRLARILATVTHTMPDMCPSQHLLGLAHKEPS